jgi:hypothetical protein
MHDGMQYGHVGVWLRAGRERRTGVLFRFGHALLFLMLANAE